MHQRSRCPLSNKLLPVPRRELIRRLGKLGFVGPFPGAGHEYMSRGLLEVRIPNPHGSDISDPFLKSVPVALRLNAYGIIASNPPGLPRALHFQSARALAGTMRDAYPQARACTCTGPAWAAEPRESENVLANQRKSGDHSQESRGGGTIHPTSKEAGILCPYTPSFLRRSS